MTEKKRLVLRRRLGDDVPTEQQATPAQEPASRSAQSSGRDGYCTSLDLEYRTRESYLMRDFERRGYQSPQRQPETIETTLTVVGIGDPELILLDALAQLRIRVGRN